MISTTATRFPILASCTLSNGAVLFFTEKLSMLNRKFGKLRIRDKLTSSKLTTAFRLSLAAVFTASTIFPLKTKGSTSSKRNITPREMPVILRNFFI